MITSIVDDNGIHQCNDLSYINYHMKCLLYSRMTLKLLMYDLSFLLALLDAIHDTCYLYLKEKLCMFIIKNSNSKKCEQ
jgi:hypothetical protein